MIPVKISIARATSVLSRTICIDIKSVPACKAIIIWPDTWYTLGRRKNAESPDRHRPRKTNEIRLVNALIRLRRIRSPRPAESPVEVCRGGEARPECKGGRIESTGVAKERFSYDGKLNLMPAAAINGSYKSRTAGRCLRLRPAT